MILIDTGPLYALVDRADAHHGEASNFYRAMAGKERLLLPLPVLTEACLLIEARLGAMPARRLWDAVIGGAFDVVQVTREDLILGRRIEELYGDASLGFVDAVCLAICERLTVRRVFTYDRRDFALYRPAFCEALELLP